jgi:hypothetical protein
VTRLLIAVVLVAAAVAVALLIQRRRPSAGPTVISEHGRPTRLDRSDFTADPSAWLLAVFVSADCVGCRQMLQAAEEQRAGPAAVEAVSLQDRPALHHRYGITAVPTTVLADVAGVVHRTWVGQVRSEMLRSEIDAALAGGD